MRTDLFGVLLAERLGSLNEGLQLAPRFKLLSCLKSAVRVDPELLRLKVDQHLLNASLDLLLSGNTRRVDIVNTRTDVAGVFLLHEDVQKLGIRLAVLDGQDISIQRGNGVEEVLELRVTEVGVDLSAVGNTSSGKLEGIDGPLDVLLTLSTGTQGETLTQSGLVNLDDLDVGGLEVNNLITQSKGKLLSLNRLVNVVTGETPTQAGDGTCEHTLHGLLSDGGSEL